MNIVIPEVGESITSGVISAWLKEDGAWVERDEAVLELETDKITQELVAPASGVLRRKAAEGDEVQIGAVVGEVDESAEKPAETGGAAGRKQQEAEGGAAQGATAVAEKAEAAPGPRVAHGGQASRANGAASAGAGRPSDEAEAAEERDGVRATPLARKLAAEQGVRLADVRGTFAGGTIREQDVRDYMANGARPGAGARAQQPAGQGAAPSGGRGGRRERMSPLRQRIATRLVEAQHTAAMLTTFNECDMSAVMDLRKRHKEAFEKKHGVGLGFMSFFMKAAASALQAHETVNASIVEGDGSGKPGPAIEYHDYCDIAVAVSTPKGLVVPVVRDVQSLSFAGIEKAIKDLAERGRDGKLSLEEMQGGTFTITNGGIFGSLNSTPILNPPQSAILGMHAIKNRAVEDPRNPGQIALRPMMYLAVSYDHRIIDGAQAVRFLVHIKDAIENPERLLLDL